MEGNIMKTNTSILVIDDENVVCESFSRILTDEGYIVDTKTKAMEGLDLALSRKYDLFFLDLKMDEITEITDYVHQESGGDHEADIIWGNGKDEALGDKINITIIAGSSSISSRNEIIHPGIRRIYLFMFF